MVHSVQMIKFLGVFCWGFCNSQPVTSLVFIVQDGGMLMS